MLYLISKYLITAGMVVLISELAKKSDRIGALVASLPLVTILTLIWLFVEGQSETKISNHAYYTFWYVLGSLPFFLIFPYLLTKLGFWGAMGVSTVLTVVGFYGYALVLKWFGVVLI